MIYSISNNSDNMKLIDYYKPQIEYYKKYFSNVNDIWFVRAFLKFTNDK